MIYSGDIGLYLSGGQIAIPSCMLFIEQPTVRQVLQFGETDFLMAVQIISDLENFLLNIKNTNNSQLEELSDFQLLLLVINQQKEVQDLLNKFFELICPSFLVEYGRNSIDFFIEEENVKKLRGQITPFTFNDFSAIVREAFGIDSDGKDGDYNPANEKAREIAEKLRKGRIKAGENANNKGSLYGTYVSILSIGLPMDINTLLNYTPFQLLDNVKRYFLKEAFDFYQKVSTTPLMDVSKMEEPEQWTNSLYNIME